MYLVMYYSATIVEMAGLSASRTINIWIAVGINAVNFLFSFPGSVLRGFAFAFFNLLIYYKTIIAKYNELEEKKEINKTDIGIINSYNEICKNEEFIRIKNIFNG